MTPEEQLVAMCGGSAEPQLTPDELTQLLMDAALPDDAGRWLTDPDWVPTYDINRAASNGWTLKAGKVAADYTITIEQRELNRGQMIDNFNKMSIAYLRMAQPRYAPAAGVLPPWRV